MNFHRVGSKLFFGASLMAAFGNLTAAEPAVASLEKISGSAVVTQDGRLVKGTAGMGLSEGDRATAQAGSSAVIQYKNGCRHELQAEESIEIDSSGPCCLDTAVATDKNQVVASFGKINGKAMANFGSSYVSAREGMGLKVDNRAMALEKSSAVILFTNGCRYTLRDDEVLEIDSHGPCCAAVPPPADKVQPAVVGALTDPNIIPPLIAAGVALCAIADCGGDNGGTVIIPPRPPISP